MWTLVASCTGVVALFGLGLGLFITIQKPVIDAANAWLDDVEDGNFDAAYDGLCEEDRDALGEEGFIEFLRLGLQPILDNPAVDTFDVDVDGDRAAVGFQRARDANEGNYTLRLRKEDGEWKACELADDGIV